MIWCSGVDGFDVSGKDDIFLLMKLCFLIKKKNKIR